MLAAVGEQSDKPLVSSFLGAEGVPELLRVPDVAGSTAGRGSVPSYPAVEAAVRALARVVEYAVVAAHPRRAEPADHDEVDAAAAKRLVNEVLMRHPDGAELEYPELSALLASYGIELWEARPVDRPRRRPSRPGRTWAGTSCSRRPPTTCASARTWRTCGATSTPRRRWRTPGSRSGELITDPENAGFVVQKNSRPGVPVAIRSIEDPLFGPVVSFGISGPLTELLADRPTGSRRWASATPRRWSARSSPRRCCSATGAARSSTSPRSSG